MGKNLKVLGRKTCSFNPKFNEKYFCLSHFL